MITVVDNLACRASTISCHIIRGLQIWSLLWSWMSRVRIASSLSIVVITISIWKILWWSALTDLSTVLIGSWYRLILFRLLVFLWSSYGSFLFCYWDIILLYLRSRWISFLLSCFFSVFLCIWNIPFSWGRCLSCTIFTLIQTTYTQFLVSWFVSCWWWRYLVKQFSCLSLNFVHPAI